LKERRNVAGETDLPEEQPGERPPSEDEPPREGAKAPRKHDDQSDEHEKATGNPHDHD
jgi:hypothetical protein